MILGDRYDRDLFERIARQFGMNTDRPAILPDGSDLYFSPMTNVAFAFWCRGIVVGEANGEKK